MRGRPEGLAADRPRLPRVDRHGVACFWTASCRQRPAAEPLPAECRGCDRRGTGAGAPARARGAGRRWQDLPRHLRRRHPRGRRGHGQGGRAHSAEGGTRTFADAIGRPHPLLRPRFHLREDRGDRYCDAQVAARLLAQEGQPAAPCHQHGGRPGQSLPDHADPARHQADRPLGDRACAAAAVRPGHGGNHPDHPLATRRRTRDGQPAVLTRRSVAVHVRRRGDHPRDEELHRGRVVAPRDAGRERRGSHHPGPRA